MRRVALAAAGLTFAAALGVWAQEASHPGQVSSRPSPSTRSPAESARQDEEMRGDLLVVRKLYPEAIAAYEHLLRQEPRNAVLLNKIGIAYHQRAMLGEAARYYHRAIKAEKTYASAINNLGTIEYERRKYRKAIRLYKQALNYDTDQAAIYSNLGYAYLADKKYDEALASFRQALELDPQLFEHRASGGSVVQQRSTSEPGVFYFFLAKTYAVMGNAERCAHYLKMARDEGYKNFAEARKDPAFARVLNDPRVRQVIEPSPPVAEAPPHSSGL